MDIKFSYFCQKSPWKPQEEIGIIPVTGQDGGWGRQGPASSSLVSGILSLQEHRMAPVCFQRKRGDIMEKKRDFRCLVSGAVFLAAALALLAAARKIPGFADWYTVHVYPLWVNLLGRLFGILPFSAAEIGIYLLLLAAAVYGVRRRSLSGIFSRAVLLAGALLLSYSLNCGINYYCVPFSAYLPYETEGHTEEELERLCRYLARQANAYADCAGQSMSGKEYGEAGVAAMTALGEEYSRLSGYYPRPKYLTVPWILSVQQLAGIYSPFTVEANYNNAMVSYNIPHTICHELSHLKGFMREDEANFIGFLACLKSDERQFLYSAYVMGWVYAGNALAAADPESYVEIRGLLKAEILTDLEANNRFWDQYEGKVADAAEAVNDTYLKANSQEHGVESYGMVVDLMLGWFEEAVPCEGAVPSD